MTLQDVLEIDLEGLEIGTESGITNPLTGVPVDINNVDELIDCFEHVKHVADQCYAVKRRVSERLAALTTSDKKTRRIEGARRRAKIELPGDSWDKKILRQAWDSFPLHAPRVLKIESIGVQLVEYKKLAETTGPAEVEELKKVVQSANRGPTGAPTVTVEQ